MTQECYQMKEAFMSSRVYLSDSFITHIEVQKDTIIYTFANGVMTNMQSANLNFERTEEAICRIEHENVSDLNCCVRKEYCLFGKLVSFGKEMAFNQLIDEINKQKISLEIIQEYYYSGRLCWICSRKNTRQGVYDEVIISVYGIKQFDVLW